MGQQSEPGDAETHQSKAEWASEQRGEGEPHALADRFIFFRVTDLVDPSDTEVDQFGYIYIYVSMKTIVHFLIETRNDVVVTQNSFKYSILQNLLCHLKLLISLYDQISEPHDEPIEAALLQLKTRTIRIPKSWLEIVSSLLMTLVTTKQHSRIFNKSHLVHLKRVQRRDD